MQSILQFLLALLLRFLKQPWSPRLFYAAKQRFAMTAVEVVVMRWDRGEIGIVLTERPPKDDTWPGQLHSPGSMLRDADVDASRSYHAAYRRVLKEIGVPAFSDKPVLVDAFPTPTPRGPENSLVFIAEIPGEPGMGRFYKLDEVLGLPTGVPGGIVPEQVYLLKRLSHLFKEVYPTLKRLR